ncbi:hypothetical protein PCASD_13942 [Puccinia coronata f. sp. avenae]|uniref:Reverse transcriptase Ty1/copia-type domain-containing protein n=1 Tax=Puccinia coronata f. sp. avenae TaxID=200324 RepID=A0A2N5UH98_9BASI|nr:hypothetical protein PCASD_13942 [Puccinia coronata f. sp. avenae]
MATSSRPATPGPFARAKRTSAVAVTKGKGKATVPLDEESDGIETESEPEEFSEESKPEVKPKPCGQPRKDVLKDAALRDRTLQVRPVKYSHLTIDPTSFKKALSCDKANSWKKSIDAELDNIKKHQVWAEHFEKPKKILHSTWVFKTKPTTNSSPKKQKARLCIQGFLQTFGKDFFKAFAPTGKFPLLLTLLVLAIDLKLPIKQFDIKSAFLFAPLEEEIFIKTPEGSSRKSPYLKLEKSLYGLKQAPKNWYDTLTSWFGDIGFNPSVSDACLFIHKAKNSFIFFHVDDLIVVGQTNQFERLFIERFPNSTAHSPDTLLGMKLNISPNLIELSQPTLIEKGLEMLSLTKSRPVKTPLTPAVQLHTASEEDHQAFLALNVNYQLYTDQETRISQSSSLAFWKSCPVLWNSKRQRNITLSSTKSEMNALSDGKQENQWLQFLVKELWNKKLALTLFNIDNKGLLEKLKHFGSNSKTKHLDIKIKNLRDKYQKEEIAMKLVSSDDMRADSLTKAAPLASVKKLQDRCLSALPSSTMEGC